MLYPHGDDWTEADDLPRWFGKLSNVDKCTARIPFLLVQEMFAASSHLDRKMLEVRGTEVILHLTDFPPKIREVVLLEMKNAGLLGQITIPGDVIASSDQIVTATRKSTQQLLFQ